MGDKLLNEDFLRLFLERYVDGTMHLRLKGKELYQRFGSRLKAKHMLTLANFLTDNPQIISVDCSYNDFGDEGLAILAENFFNKENSLLHISFMMCDISGKGMKAFSTSPHLHLKSCRLNGNKIGAEGARHIAKIIENCPSLEYIDMAETDQTLESIESILIVTEDSNLRVLDISRIIPKSFYTKYNQATLADDLAVAIKLNSHLVELHVQKLEFDGHDVDILLSGLRSNTTLEVLDLGYNNIGDLGIEMIATFLTTRPPLRGLSVAGNGIKTLGARAMSFGLPFSKLRFLDISSNLIGDQGLRDLLDSIKKSTRMRILYMWGNRFGQKTGERLYRMIEAGVLEQEYTDVKIHVVDGQYEAAHYPTNYYKSNYYSLMEYGYADTLKIKKRDVLNPMALPRQLLNLTHIGRYPKVNKELGLYRPKKPNCGDKKDK